MGTMEFQSYVQPLGVGGIQIAKPKDKIDPNKLAYIRNMRVYQIGELRCRPGLGTTLFSSDASGAIHTLRRFNDTLAGTNAFIVGSGANLYYAQEAGALVSKLTTLSGKPLSVVFIRPSQSAKAWAYIADSTAMYKMDTAGNTRNWSILPLNEPVTAVVTERAHKVIDDCDSATGWANSGTAGAISAVNYRIDFAIPSGGILYDSGTTGWANLVPGTMTADFQPGAMMTYNPGGGTEEGAKIFSVSQASGTTTIASIKYDSGTTGLATVLLTTPTENLTPNSTIQITTGATPYNVRVIEVIPSSTNLPSIRINATVTHAAGDAVVGVRSYRTYLQNNHVATENVRSSYLAFTNSAGVGYATKGSLTLDLTKSAVPASPVLPFTDDDEVHISILLSNPALLTELQVKLDCDRSTNDGTQNYYYYAVQASAFASVSTSTTTTLTATQVDVQRGAIIGYQVPNDYNNYGSSGYGDYRDSGYGGYRDQYSQGYAGQTDYSLTAPTGIYTEPVYGPASTVGSNTSGVSDTAAGANQWTELSIKRSDFKRIGSDLSRGWKDIAALVIQVNSIGSLDVRLDSFYITGAYNTGPTTVSNIALPYNYCVVCRDRNTGDRSLPSPPLRSGLQLTRNGVTVSITESSDAQVTDYDIYRQGGTLTEWIYIGSAPHEGDGTTTFFDNLQDQDILSNPTLSREDYPVFPMLDIPRSGTATIVGNVLTSASGDTFNTLWAAGVRVLVKDSNNRSYLCGLYRRPTSTTVLELDESPGYTGTVSWVISEPVLLNQPLAAVWGPYGSGIDNPYIFACGSTYQAGTLFWTNSGRPGSSSLRNQLEITSPQEPLIGGCIYDGQAFCWSRKRMFRIFPSGEGQFQAQEVANSKGLSSRVCIAVGQVMFFLGDDGLYATTGGQPYSTTDRDLYTLFPHDSQLGETTNSIDPPDFTQRDKFNLEYKNDLLYFTYYSTGAVYRTLVFDVSKLTAGLNANPEEAGAWISLDDYTPNVTLVCNEDPDNDDRSRLFLGTSTGKVYLPSATADVGVAIPYAFETKSFSFDSPEDFKLWHSYDVDCDLGGTTATFATRSDLSASTVTQDTGTNSSRSTLEVPINTGQGLSNRYLSAVVSGSSSVSASPKFYHISFSFTPQSHATADVWSQPETLDDLGAKWIQGIEIDGDTLGVNKRFQVIYDGATEGPIITINHNGQVAKGYAFDPPFIAHTVRLKPLDSVDSKLISVNWIWEPEPDLVTVWQPQPTTHDFPGWQHVRSGYLALRSTSTVTLTIIADATRTTTYTIASTSGELKKIYFPVFAKGRSFSYRLSSSSGFRVYQRDLELHVKPWGSGEDYAIVKPYGKPTRTNGGATI